MSINYSNDDDLMDILDINELSKEDGERQLLEDGEYVFRIHNPEIKRSKAGKKSLTINLQVISGEKKGNSIFQRFNYGFYEDAERVREMAAVLGFEKIETNRLQDKTIAASVIVEYSDFYQKDINKVTKFHKAQEDKKENSYQAVKDGAKVDDFDEDIPF